MEKTITKHDLVNRIFDEMGSSVNQADVLEVVQKTLDYIAEALVNGDRVVLRNFGSFFVKEVAPKVGRNPRTPDKTISIPARRVVRFKAGKVLRDVIGGEEKAES